MEDIKKWSIEALKEGLRVFIVSAIPLLIVQLQNNNIDFKVLFFAGVAGILKALDKFLHEYKKDIGTEGEFKGLIGF